jgi:phage replication O-like protein O
VHLEDNFTQVPNDILDALARTDLSQNESKIVFLVIRKTFGWHKKTDWISLSQIEEGTGIAKPNICRSLRALKRKGIIVRQDHRHIGLQSDYTKWQ